MKYLIYILVLFSSLESISQKANIEQVIGIQAGFNYCFGSEANMNISISYAAYRNVDVSKHFSIMPSYQSAINIYYNGIGNNKFKSKVTIDWNNSFALTAGLDESVYGDNNTKKINKNGFYYLNQSYTRSVNIIPIESIASLTFATNFILNHKNRNQQYGCILIQPLPFFRVQYCNDGGPGISKLRLGDKYDRWWTGGGFAEFGNDLDSLNGFEFSKVRISYERFTWDNSKAYTASSILGLPTIPLAKDGKLDYFSNSGKYTFDVFVGHGIFSFAGVNKIKDGQDIIHERVGAAKHPTLLLEYWSLGYLQNIRY